MKNLPEVFGREEPPERLGSEQAKRTLPGFENLKPKKLGACVLRQVQL